MTRPRRTAEVAAWLTPCSCAITVLDKVTSTNLARSALTARSGGQPSQFLPPEPNVHLLALVTGRIDAHWPRLVDLHEHQRRPGQRHVLREVDHLVHALLRIVDLPEAMHLHRHRNEEADDRRKTLARLDAG